jgi:tetratricopeptide (TPR) repeat protein
MSKSSLIVIAVLIACFVLPAQMVFAADGGEKKEPVVRERGGDGDRRDRGGRDRRGRWEEMRKRFAATRAAAEKQRKGEPLNEEEKKIVERVNRFRRDAGVDGARGGRAGQTRATGVSTLRRLKSDVRLNVIDDAYCRIAEVHVSQKSFDKAIEALQRMAKKSPDKLAVSLAHLNMAELYRKEMDKKKLAITEYKAVTGEYTLEAQRRLATLFEEMKEIDQAVATFEELVKASPDKMQKVLALRELADLLYRNQRADEAVAVLQSLTEVVNYKEAEEVTKTLRETAEQRQKAATEQREQTRGWGRDRRR